MQFVHFFPPGIADCPSAGDYHDCVQLKIIVTDSCMFLLRVGAREAKKWRLKSFNEQFYFNNLRKKKQTSRNKCAEDDEACELCCRCAYKRVNKQSGFDVMVYSYGGDACTLTIAKRTPVNQLGNCTRCTRTRRWRDCGMFRTPAYWWNVNVAVLLTHSSGTHNLFHLFINFRL